MIEEAHTKWALLSSPALFLNASAMAALSTADALKQEGRRALVVGADKAKLASLALGRPETMVGEGGELVLRGRGENIPPPALSLFQKKFIALPTTAFLPLLKHALSGDGWWVA